MKTSQMNKIPIDSDFVQRLKPETDLPNIDVLHEVVSDLSKRLAQRFDDIFKMALKKHGYEFESESEYHAFVSKYVRAEDYKRFQIKRFFVIGVPFLEHHYGTKTEFEATERKVSISSNWGAYLTIERNE